MEDDIQPRASDPPLVIEEPEGRPRPFLERLLGCAVVHDEVPGEHVPEVDRLQDGHESRRGPGLDGLGLDGQAQGLAGGAEGLRVDWMLESQKVERQPGASGISSGPAKSRAARGRLGCSGNAPHPAHRAHGAAPARRAPPAPPNASATPSNSGTS